MIESYEKSLKETLKKHACYVLITCEEPNDDGYMEVKMTCEGDSTLASYLLQGAQNMIEEQDEQLE